MPLVRIVDLVIDYGLPSFVFPQAFVGYWSLQHTFSFVEVIVEEPAKLGELEHQESIYATRAFILPTYASAYSMAGVLSVNLLLH